MIDYPYEAIVVLGDKDEIVEYTGDEVVRCKNCRKREKINGITVCPIAWIKAEVPDDGFCSLGERAEA